MENATTGTEQLWFLDGFVEFQVSHAEGTDGISVMEQLVPHGDSPPLHIHHGEDEVFCVREGELRLRVGAEDLRVGAGESALTPKGVPHTYRVESPEGARLLVVTTHGDFERFVRAMSRPAERPELPESQGPPPTEQVEALASTAREHSIELVGPPLD